MLKTLAYHMRWESSIKFFAINNSTFSRGTGVTNLQIQSYMKVWAMFLQVWNWTLLLQILSHLVIPVIALVLVVWNIFLTAMIFSFITVMSEQTGADWSGFTLF